ncbi:DUF4041 domain-containing protein [Limosilactobacillus caecicola]|uniref:DUF4041 domain-containing protein n=1 Tax=Limosilactobacillus caecicola TaxID=2941332 RepID=UPI00203B2933|nr:DUF4041 domain-containing protein [Limosilactobacillus caecicola]
MSLLDIFKVGTYKSEISELQRKNAELQKIADLKMTASQMEPVELEKLIDEKRKQLEETKSSLDKESASLESLNIELQALQVRLAEAKKDLVSVDEEVQLESYGLYKPRYDFTNSAVFKERLQQVRQEQKQMIKDGTAGLVFRPMLLDNSKSKGRAMQSKNIKQLVRSFNVECEAAVNKVTKANIESIEKRINRSFDQLNRLNEPNGVRLTDDYRDSKLDEAHIALEYALKKEEEKDILREQREREREEKQLQRELAAERKKYEKDEQHFIKAESEVQQKISEASDDEEINSLKSQLAELQQKLAEIQEHKEKLDHREENPTAGYVYIISNIGAFGENVFKIGVTRRLDPMDRIHELGSASVPFPFDVHALIFSDDAFKLEASLHEHFAKDRVNQVNKRKEYFNITISDIKQALEKYKDLTFDFNEYPIAEEYRDSQKIIESMS